MNELSLLAFLFPIVPPLTWVQPIQPPFGFEQFYSHFSPAETSTAAAWSDKPDFNLKSVEYWQHFYQVSELRSKIDDFVIPARVPANDIAIKVSNQTAASAKALLEGLTADYDLPHVSASDDGEIGFLWFRNGCRIEALLDSDNHLIWFWSDKDAMHAGGEQVFDGAFPDELLAMIDRKVG